MVISTGPYAIVRHPMYSGTGLLYVATPLALGSWWAVPPPKSRNRLSSVSFVDGAFSPC